MLQKRYFYSKNITKRIFFLKQMLKYFCSIFHPALTGFVKMIDGFIFAYMANNSLFSLVLKISVILIIQIMDLRS